MSHECLNNKRSGEAKQDINNGTDEFIPLLQSPLTKGIRSIQRNRRGSAKYGMGNHNRNYIDDANPRRKQMPSQHRGNLNHGCLIESLLRQSDDGRSPSKLGKSALSNQSDRYGPLGKDDIFDRHDVTAPPPPVIFTLPCFSNVARVQTSHRKVVFFRALILFMTLTFLIILMIVMVRSTNVYDYAGGGNFRYAERSTPIQVHKSNATSPHPGESTADSMNSLKHRVGVIGGDNSMDIGFAAGDDMIFDQIHTNASFLFREEELMDDQVGLTDHIVELTRKPVGHANVINNKSTVVTVDRNETGERDLRIDAESKAKNMSS